MILRVGRLLAVLTLRVLRQHRATQLTPPVAGTATADVTVTHRVSVAPTGMGAVIVPRENFSRVRWTGIGVQFFDRPGRRDALRPYIYFPPRVA